MRLLFALALALAGCSESPTETNDLAAPSDLTSSTGPVTLTVGQSTTPLGAWYSMVYVAIPESGEPSSAQLIVFFIDPSFQCTAQSPGDVDAIAFQFQSLLPGVTSTAVFSRAGPHLGTVGGSEMGSAELATVDARYQTTDVDAGVVHVAPGGSVTGSVRWSSGEVTVAGDFDAPHCPLLDEVVSF